MTYYNFFKTEQDFEGIMRGAYETYRGAYEYSTPRAISGEIMDECDHYLTKALRILDATTINSDVTACSWYSYYQAITQAMMVIENIDFIKLYAISRLFGIGGIVHTLRLLTRLSL